MRRFDAQTIRAFVPQTNHPYENHLLFERVFTPRQCDRSVEAGLALAPDEPVRPLRPRPPPEPGGSPGARGLP